MDKNIGIYTGISGLSSGGSNLGLYGTLLWAMEYGILVRD